MGNRSQDLISDPRPKEVLVPAGITPDSGETFREVPTREKLLHDAADDRPVEAVLLLIPGGIGCLEFA
jgi:hypothetical protein